MRTFVLFVLIFSSLAGWTRPKIQSDIPHFQDITQTLMWFQQEESKMASTDRRGLFLRVYHEVTLEMINLFNEHKFQNPEWTKKLMLKYLSFYRNAYECYQSRTCAVSPAWKKVFDENAGTRWSPGIQLLLAISAHVNRDLPIVLAQIDTDFSNESLRSDFRTVSSIFSRRMPNLLKVMQMYQKCPLNDREKKFIQDEVMWAMGRTRERSWNNGAKLAHAQSDSEETAQVEKIERYTHWQDLDIVILSPIPQKLLCL